MQRKNLRRLALASLATIALLDLGINWIALRDGTFGWRPVAPYGAVNSPAQREWLAGQKRELSEALRGGAVAQFDPELGWTNRAGRGSAPNAPLSFTYGALGARSKREYEPRPPAGITRLVCFGDSFTHCDEVGDLDTWEHQLEALDPAFEALNFGVGGYGTDQALLRFRRDGRDLGARVVCIGLMLENLGRNVNRYRPLWYPRTNACAAKPRFVLEGGELRLVPMPYATRAELVAAVDSGSVLDDLAEREHWRAGVGMSWLRYSAFARLAVSARCHWLRNVERLHGDTEGEPFRVTVAILEAFAREALAAGAERAVVLVFPREGDLEGLALDGDRFWQPMLDELARRGIEVLDLPTALAPAWLAARADPTLPRIYQGGHLGRAGNAVVARELRAWLATRR